MTNQTIYTVGGTVQAGGGIYIKRKADDELLQHCRAGEFAFILSSRQVGKSSLMVRTAQQLERENIHSVIIDLSGIGVKISADEWYLGILNEIANTLELKTNIFTWWSERAGLGPTQRLTNFFRDVLFKEVNEPVVLFFDEIDSMLSIPFADDFFAALRAIYNARSTVPDFKQLSFVMIGVATPGQLIADNKRTPFNIGHRVDLTDFTFEEALPLAGELDKQVLRWILAWTGGHPYLTQRLCAHFSKSETKLTEESVAAAVKKLFEGEQGWQDNNLQFVRDMLTKRSPNLSRVLKTYKDIREDKKVTDDERSIAKAHLKISGVVRSENGFLRPRNRIYKNVFTAKWAQDNIPKNWAKYSSVGFGLAFIFLLSIFIINSVTGSLSDQYVGEFYTSKENSEKLKKLANLFDLEGIAQNTNYDFRARELFYNLNWKDQTSLFQDPYVSLKDKQKYLPKIVAGLYVTMANIKGGQDNSDLLLIMKDSLDGVNTPVSKKLQEEIALWLEAREATTDEVALSKYDEAIDKNGDNPATHYERAIIELRKGFYKKALLDLNTTIGLANNLSSEASEKKITTPTPRPTKTRSSQTNIPIVRVTTSPVTHVVSTSAIGITNTPFVNTQSPTATKTPSDPSPLVAREGYKSSFYSIAYIRSAVDLVLQEYNLDNDFQNVIANSVPTLTNLTNAGLINPTSMVEVFATQTAMAQTPTLNTISLIEYFATGTALENQGVVGQPLIDYYATGTALFGQTEQLPTAVPTDTVLTGKPNSTTVLATDTSVPTSTPIPPVAIGQDWIAGCISSLWKTYPSNFPTVERGDGCWQEPIYAFSAENGDLDFLSERGSGTTEIYGLFAPLPESGTVTFTVRLRDLNNADLWMGVFAEPDVTSQGLLMTILNGDVNRRAIVQKNSLTYETMQGTVALEQENGFSISFTFTPLSARSRVNPNVFVGNPVSIQSAQKWLFLGYKGLSGPYRIEGTFLNFELK